MSDNPRGEDEVWSRHRPSDTKWRRYNTAGSDDRQGEPRESSGW